MELFFDNRQLEKAAKLAKTMGMTFLAGKGEVPQDFEWLGKLLGWLSSLIKEELPNKTYKWKDSVLL